MAKYHTDCHVTMKNAVVFPIEVDLARSTFTYDQVNNFTMDGEDEDEEDDDDELIGTETQDNCLTGDLLQ